MSGDRVVLHAFLDGRDTPPRSAAGYLSSIESTMESLQTGRVGSVIGRYFAMDRDKRWDRTEQAFRALVQGEGKRAATAQEGLRAAYERGGDRRVCRRDGRG